MQVRLIGLGRMGFGMAPRLLRAEHACIDRGIVDTAVTERATGARDGGGTRRGADPAWNMPPAAVVDHMEEER